MTPVKYPEYCPPLVVVKFAALLVPDSVEVAPIIAAPVLPIVAAFTSGEFITVPAFSVVTDS